MCDVNTMFVSGVLRSWRVGSHYRLHTSVTNVGYTVNVPLESENAPSWRLRRVSFFLLIQPTLEKRRRIARDLLWRRSKASGSDQAAQCRVHNAACADEPSKVLWPTRVMP